MCAVIFHMRREGNVHAPVCVEYRVVASRWRSIRNECCMLTAYLFHPAGCGCCADVLFTGVPVRKDTAFTGEIVER